MSEVDSMATVPSLVKDALGVAISVADPHATHMGYL